MLDLMESKYVAQADAAGSDISGLRSAFHEREDYIDVFAFCRKPPDQAAGRIPDAPKNKPLPAHCSISFRAMMLRIPGPLGLHARPAHDSG